MSDLDLQFVVYTGPLKQWHGVLVGADKTYRRADGSEEIAPEEIIGDERHFVGYGSREDAMDAWEGYCRTFGRG